MSDEEYLRRFEVCRGCEMWRMLEMLGIEQCKACGCVIAIKAKVKASDCPKGKW